MSLLLSEKTLTNCQAQFTNLVKVPESPTKRAGNREKFQETTITYARLQSIIGKALLFFYNPNLELKNRKNLEITKLKP